MIIDVSDRSDLLGGNQAIYASNGEFALSAAFIVLQRKLRSKQVSFYLIGTGVRSSFDRPMSLVFLCEQDFAGFYRFTPWLPPNYFGCPVHPSLSNASMDKSVWLI